MLRLEFCNESKFTADGVGTAEETRVMKLKGVGKYPHVIVGLTTASSNLPTHSLSSKKKKGIECVLVH